jgi:hypothetical protein
MTRERASSGTVADHSHSAGMRHDQAGRDGYSEV